MFHADILVPLTTAPACPGDYRPLASRPFETLREAEAWLATNREMWRGALLESETRFLMVVTDVSGSPALMVEHSCEWGTEGVRHSRRALRAMMGGAS